MRRGRTFAILAAAMLAALPQAAAGQAEEDIRWVDRQGSSSDCIGSPVSAGCAVETALACRVRRDAALCGAVGLALPREEELPFARRNPDPFAIVEATGVKYLIHDEEQGDSRRIGVSVRFHGKYGLNWPDRGWRRLIYGVRRAGGAWLVDDISWQPWIRMIGPRDASSKCIGAGDTPVCAVETHIACRLRDDAALCADAGGLEPRHFRPKGATVLYTIDRIRKWEPPELAASGSIFVVVWSAESTDLPPPGTTDPSSFYIARPGFVAVSYTLERLRGQWRVTTRTERP
ncbi:MAG: hypothetical protein KAR37_03630 [Alphaproteobacteria bacterium]|jgi:hypothetical protein|nr:hypothetical protein [Alphaproteobacteria bacterium]